MSSLLDLEITTPRIIALCGLGAAIICLLFITIRYFLTKDKVEKRYEEEAKREAEILKENMEEIEKPIEEDLSQNSEDINEDKRNN